MDIKEEEVLHVQRHKLGKVQLIKPANIKQ
jgi:hypothetical protein